MGHGRILLALTRDITVRLSCPPAWLARGFYRACQKVAVDAFGIDCEPEGHARICTREPTRASLHLRAITACMRILLWASPRYDAMEVRSGVFRWRSTKTLQWAILSSTAGIALASVADTVGSQKGKLKFQFEKCLRSPSRHDPVDIRRKRFSLALT